MRADRLVAALLLLQARGRMTAGQLAEELEVSVATARRDMEALSAAGIPVYPQPGRGGGWSLLGGARTDLTGLTAAEARALFLLVGPSTALDPEARSALRKLVGALPDPFRADAEAASTAVVIDPTRWGEPAREAEPLVGLLRDAVISRRRVRFRYRSRSGTTMVRTVDPWGLVDKDGTNYVVAGTPTGQRTFRLDRITEAEPTDEGFERPADFDLGDAWSRVVGEMEQRRSVVGATVHLAPWLLGPLRDHFGRHLDELGAAPDGRVIIRVAAHTARAVAEQLAGWGPGVDVVEPAEVRTELARIGADLTARYG